MLVGSAGRANLTLRVCAGPIPAGVNVLVRGGWGRMVRPGAQTHPLGLRLANPSVGEWWVHWWMSAGQWSRYLDAIAGCVFVGGQLISRAAGDGGIKH